MEVAFFQIDAPQSRHTTQGPQSKSCLLTSTGLSPSMVGHSRPLQFHKRERDRALLPHIYTWFPMRIQFGLFPFRSPLTQGIPVGFFSSSYLDVSVRKVSAPKEGAPRIFSAAGSPIRASPDRRLHAPTRSISLLATPFVGAQAKPSVR